MTPLIIDSICTQYQIDEDGNIYNIRTKKYLLGTIRSGYRMVKLTINGKKRDFSINRIILMKILKRFVAPKICSIVSIHYERTFVLLYNVI